MVTSLPTLEAFLSVARAAAGKREAAPKTSKARMAMMLRVYDGLRPLVPQGAEYWFEAPRAGETPAGYAERAARTAHAVASGEKK